jgi:enterochelin esterase-like enzyme
LEDRNEQILFHINQNRHPMKFNFFVIILAFLSGCVQNPHQQFPKVSSGTIVRFENFKTEIIEPRNVDVWLPSGYNPDDRYTVLYMHDGQMLFDSAITWNRQEWGVDETMSRLISDGTIEKNIVVGIWNISEIRHSDYFPQKPFNYLGQQFRDSIIKSAQRNKDTQLFKTNINSDNYLRFIVEELKPFIDENFSTLPGPEATFVAGSSMGGLISMYAMCEYPDVFGGAACISTHWPGIFNFENNPIPGAFANYLRENLPPPGNHKIYFDFGTETLDAVYEPYQKMMDEVMKEKGYSADNWMTRKFEGEDHSENAWRERFEIPVVFLLGK